MRIKRGDGGSGPPWKVTKNIGFLSNMVPDPLKTQSYQSSIQCRAIIGPPAKRHLNGVSLAGRWLPANSGIWIPPHQAKNPSKLDPSAKTSWMRHIWQNEILSELMFIPHTTEYIGFCMTSPDLFYLPRAVQRFSYSTSGWASARLIGVIWLFRFIKNTSL